MQWIHSPQQVWVGITICYVFLYTEGTQLNRLHWIRLLWFPHSSWAAPNSLTLRFCVFCKDPVWVLTVNCHVWHRFTYLPGDSEILLWDRSRSLTFRFITHNHLVGLKIASAYSRKSLNNSRRSYPSELRTSQNTIPLRGGIAQWYSTELRAGWSAVRFPTGTGNFLFTTTSRPALGPTQTPILWVPEALSLGLKGQGREDDHLPPYSAEVSAWSLPPLPQYALMAWLQKKYGDNFTFHLLPLPSLFHTPYNDSSFSWRYITSAVDLENVRVPLFGTENSKMMYRCFKAYLELKWTGYLSWVPRKQFLHVTELVQDTKGAGAAHLL
jgi:hypothetical protein